MKIEQFTCNGGGFFRMNSNAVRVWVTEDVEGKDKPMKREVEVRLRSYDTADFEKTFVSKKARDTSIVKITKWYDTNGCAVPSTYADGNHIDAAAYLREAVLAFVGEKALDLYAEAKIDYEYSPIVNVLASLNASRSSLEKMGIAEQLSICRREFTPRYTKHDSAVKPPRPSTFDPTGAVSYDTIGVMTVTGIGTKVISLITPFKDKFFCEFAYTKQTMTVETGRRLRQTTKWVPLERSVMREGRIAEEVLKAHEKIFDRDQVEVLKKLKVKDQIKGMLNDIEHPGTVASIDRIEAKVLFTEDEGVFPNDNYRSYIKLTKDEHDGYSIDHMSLPKLQLDDVKQILSILSKRIADHVVDVKIDRI